MKLQKITIVGLGLMGGSLAAACRKRLGKIEITGVSRNPQAIRYAKSRGWIDRGFQDLKKALDGSRLVVLCTPVDTLAAFIAEVDRLAAPETMVTDVGSVKGTLFRQLTRKKLRRVSFVGAHPMVGSHEHGIRAATAGLYDRGLIFVMKDSPASAQASRRVKAFWRLFSPHIVEIVSSDHDRIVSEISHLPHAVAACLMLSVHPKNLRYAAAGFRDTTRIAASIPAVWQPIFLENRQALKPVFNEFERAFKNFRRAVLSADESEIRRLLEDASLRRREI